MIDQFSRTKLLYGNTAIDHLKDCHIAVFGVGGVGGYVCEALARSGVGHFDLIDNDVVSITNLNRQIIALTNTIGKYKVDVMKERILNINPSCEVNTFKCFFLPETENEFDFTKYDYVVDAIDTVAGKIALVLKSNKENVKIISSMGAGNKLNPQAFLVSDIYKTKIDPLARVMRSELKKRRVKKLKVVYSTEYPVKPKEISNEKTSKRSVPGSTAFVPASCGLLIASEIINDLTKDFN